MQDEGHCVSSGCRDALSVADVKVSYENHFSESAGQMQNLKT